MPHPSAAETTESGQKLPSCGAEEEEQQQKQQKQQQQQQQQQQQEEAQWLHRRRSNIGETSSSCESKSKQELLEQINYLEEQLIATKIQCALSEEGRMEAENRAQGLVRTLTTIQLADNPDTVTSGGSTYGNKNEERGSSRFNRLSTSLSTLSSSLSSSIFSSAQAPPPSSHVPDFSGGDSRGTTQRSERSKSMDQKLDKSHDRGKIFQVSSSKMYGAGLSGVVVPQEADEAANNTASAKPGFGNLFKSARRSLRRQN